MFQSFNDAVWEAVPESPTVPDQALARLIGSLGLADQNVLDLGCGDGKYFEVLKRCKAQITGADPSAIALDRARQRDPSTNTVRVSDDGLVPLPDNTFDLIWSADTIEHVLDVQTYISEARRLLKPGGKMIIVTPAHTITKRLAIALFRWNRHFHPNSPHIRFFTATTLAGTLTTGGFNPPSISHQNGQNIATATRP